MYVCVFKIFISVMVLRVMVKTKSFIIHLLHALTEFDYMFFFLTYNLDIFFKRKCIEKVSKTGKTQKWGTDENKYC